MVPVEVFLSVHYPYDRMSVDPIGGHSWPLAKTKSERLHVRTTPNMKALLQRAAASSHKNVTEFLLEAGINAAEDALVDRRIFRLDDRQWLAFQALLDRPVAADKPRLTRLLAGEDRAGVTPGQEALSPVEKLDATHDVDSFECWKEPLDRFLKRFALANQKADGARTYVACRGLTVLAYYSLAAGAVEHADAPLRVGKGLARHPIPVMLLARLAVDLTWQGRGLGKALVKDALLRTAAARRHRRYSGTSRPCQGRRGAELVRSLGIRAEPHGSLSLVLAHEGPAGNVERMKWVM